MVLDVVPVIPPDLRPLVLLESGNFATSDLERSVSEESSIVITDLKNL